ncbi:MAG: tellurite resistance TerB family protein [Gammaproteobacteria bacterium]|nr:tellurite resistance TerB family protein [Gammaproteobacteria bacterium]
MFNARDLLDSLAQSGVSSATQDRLGHAMGPKGLGSRDSPFGQILGQVLGGGQGGQGAGSGLGGLLGGLMGQAGGLANDATSAVKSGNPLAVGGLAALAGALLGGGGDAVKGALGGGLLAVLGGLAMNVLKQQQGGAGAAVPLGLRAPATATEESALENRAVLLIGAMVDAAKADGEIDAAERGRIAGRLRESGADAQALDFLMAEMQRPASLDALVAKVRSPEEAVEVYAASVLAIEIDTEAERAYLARLARALNLDARVVAEIHSALGAPVAA